MKKISITLSGHQTSITLEDIFIETLKKISTSQNKSIHSIINEIDSKRSPESNLSAEVRIWIVNKLLETAKI